MEEELSEDREQNKSKGLFKRVLSSIRSSKDGEPGVGFNKDTVVKLAKFGGNVSVNKDNMWMYKGTGNTTKKLFGFEGPLHPGIPYKREMAVGSVESDTRQDLVKELMDKGLTREESVKTISEALREGLLVEVYDPDLRQKVLVFRGS